MSEYLEITKVEFQVLKESLRLKGGNYDPTLFYGWTQMLSPKHGVTDYIYIQFYIY
jgi:hypothetical protein